MHFVKVLICVSTITTATAVVSSCVVTEKAKVKVGLCRSDLTSWECKRCDEAGVQVDIPKDAYRFWDASNNVSLLFHPVYPPRNIVAEPQMMLTVSFDRRTVAAQKKTCDGLLRFETNAIKRSGLVWEYAFHSSTDLRIREPWSYYRRDYVLDSNTLWVGRAELLRVKDGSRMPFLEEDNRAIRRIFDSFKPDR